MNYIKISPIDVANGPGCRVVLWVSGCSHHCKECHNPETWNPNAGQVFDEEAKDELFRYLSKHYITGITLSGGDPLYNDNIDTITELCKEIKEKYPEKDIWCYSGYTFEEIKDLEILQYIDVLVDGKFEIEKKNIQLLFRGSENQRLICVPETLKFEEIVFYQKK
jgi:anaerobic ribonucleoside-triphosphate reductase activating protein